MSQFISILAIIFLLPGSVVLIYALIASFGDIFTAKERFIGRVYSVLFVTVSLTLATIQKEYASDESRTMYSQGYTHIAVKCIDTCRKYYTRQSEPSANGCVVTQHQTICNIDKFYRTTQ